MMKDEEARRIATMEAFRVADKKPRSWPWSLLKLKEIKKSAEVALDGAKRQSEAQRKQLRQAEDDLSTARNQIKILTKKLEEAEKAKE